MRSLAKWNCRKYDVSRFFADLEVKLSLVFQEAFENRAGRNIDLVIGKRRRYTLSCECNPLGDVYMLVEKDDIFLAYDKLEICREADLQNEWIDIEGYLIAKGYQYTQLDSKAYSRERARKKVYLYSCEINKYGEFDAGYSWLDIEVFSASASLFPGACKMGNVDVVRVSYSSFNDTMIEVIREMTTNPHCWDTKSFTDFFERLSQCNGGTIKTATGMVLFGGFIGGELEITREFEEGKYTYTTKFDNIHHDSDKIKKLGTFAYAIMCASSLEACKNIEIKSILFLGT